MAARLRSSPGFGIKLSSITLVRNSSLDRYVRRDERSMIADVMDAVPGIREDEAYADLALMIGSFDNLHGLDKHEFLGRVFEAAFGLIPEAQKGSLYELQGDRFNPVFSKGYDRDILSRISFGRADAFIDFAVDEGAPIRAYETKVRGRDDWRYSSDMLAAFKSLGTYSGFSSLYAPIRVDGHTRGLISLEIFGDGRFSKLSRMVLQYYARLISEFYAQKMYQEKESALYRGVVASLVSAIEVMDSYTVGHGKRVSDYSRAIAREFGLSAREEEAVGTAALLHDVGKLGIPSELLRKPGPLLPEEEAVVRQHPANSARILESIQGFGDIVDMARWHHERFDGAGYPDGLAGDRIPTGAQIIQVADSFDAMTSDRSYRPALSREGALAELLAGSGTQFNPRVVRAALAALARAEPSGG